MLTKTNNNLPYWLILAVSLGLIAYSLTAIILNGYKHYLLYPILLAIINIIALIMLKK